ASGYLLHRRWSPCAVEDRGIAFIWPVHSQHQNELACRCGQPVTFLLWSGAVLLDIQVSRTVRARFQVLSRTDRIPVDRVSHKEVLGVIHSDRPEALSGWGLALLKMDDVFVRSLIVLVVRILERGRIHSVLWSVCAKPDSGDQCPRKIIGAV